MDELAHITGAMSNWPITCQLGKAHFFSRMDDDDPCVLIFEQILAGMAFTQYMLM
jgi:hypothetical protein